MDCLYLNTGQSSFGDLLLDFRNIRLPFAHEAIEKEDRQDDRQSHVGLSLGCGLWSLVYVYDTNFGKVA